MKASTSAPPLAMAAKTMSMTLSAACADLGQVSWTVVTLVQEVANKHMYILQLLLILCFQGQAGRATPTFLKDVRPRIEYCFNHPLYISPDYGGYRILEPLLKLYPSDVLIYVLGKAQHLEDKINSNTSIQPEDKLSGLEGYLSILSQYVLLSDPNASSRLAEFADSSLRAVRILIVIEAAAERPPNRKVIRRFINDRDKDVSEVAEAMLKRK